MKRSATVKNVVIPIICWIVLATVMFIFGSCASIIAYDDAGDFDSMQYELREIE